jgi:hypothetical protein
MKTFRCQILRERQIKSLLHLKIRSERVLLKKLTKVRVHLKMKVMEINFSKLLEKERQELKNSETLRKLLKTKLWHLIVEMISLLRNLAKNQIQNKSKNSLKSRKMYKSNSKWSLTRNSWLVSTLTKDRNLVQETDSYVITFSMRVGKTEVRWPCPMTL